MGRRPWRTWCRATRTACKNWALRPAVYSRRAWEVRFDSGFTEIIRIPGDRHRGRGGWDDRPADAIQRDPGQQHPRHPGQDTRRPDLRLGASRNAQGPRGIICRSACRWGSNLLVFGRMLSSKGARCSPNCPCSSSRLLVTMLPGAGQALMLRQTLEGGAGWPGPLSPAPCTGLLIWTTATAAGLSNNSAS